MPNQSTPEIDRLREQASTIYGIGKWVPIPTAIQAVRDTETNRTREIVEFLRAKDPSTGMTFAGVAALIERQFTRGDQ